MYRWKVQAQSQANKVPIVRKTSQKITRPYDSHEI